MGKVFAGLLFLFLDFCLGHVNILPAFVGYLFIGVGVAREKVCPSTEGSRMLALVSALITGGFWVLEVFGWVPQVGIMDIPVPIGLILKLWMTWRLVGWTEELVGPGPRIERFRISWYTLILGLLVNFLLSFWGGIWDWLALAALLGTMIFYCGMYYRIWKG